MLVMHPTEIARELGEFPFFSGFPSDLLLLFSTMARPARFQVGELLLSQGKENDFLFFLRSGKLGIEVDGETVSELSAVGEVFGEMSLINRQPVTASVKSLTEVEVFQVSESYLQTLPQKDLQTFQQLLYRVYSSVLAERLKKTNDKAKRFEATNRELLATQGRLKTINENLEKEIMRRSHELVQKIRNLTESHLLPTQNLLAQWAQIESPRISGPEVHSLLSSISEVVDFLKPITELNNHPGHQRSKKILLCDVNRKQQVIAKLALGGSGVDLNIASTIEEFDSQLKSAKFDLVLCDAELPEAEQHLKLIPPNTPVVLLVTTNMDFYLETIKKFPDQPYFVSRDLENRGFTIKNISTTVAKILNQDFFGLEKYLSWGSRILEEPVKNSTERLELIEKMKTHFQSFGIRPVVLDRVHTVTEEMLMNSIYDAPVDSSGKSLFNHLSRTEKISLNDSQQARLRFGTDGVLLAVSVEDPFGSLSKKVITNYLESCYTGNAGTLDQQKGGAGRGLHMIIESADLTIFNVSKNNRTEVICLFNLDRSKEEIIQPTFHLFFNE
jgi:CRP-like cAMP-binding protein/sulfur transfer complex TusBCD TusB component (DsrH family)